MVHNRKKSNISTNKSNTQVYKPKTASPNINHNNISSTIDTPSSITTESNQVNHRSNELIQSEQQVTPIHNHADQTQSHETKPTQHSTESSVHWPITLKYNIINKSKEIIINFRAPLIQTRNDISLLIDAASLSIDFNTRPIHFAYDTLIIDLTDEINKINPTINLKLVKHKLRYFSDRKKFVISFDLNTMKSSTESPSQGADPVDEEYVIEVSDNIINQSIVNEQNGRLSPVFNPQENDTPITNHTDSTHTNSIVQPNCDDNHMDDQVNDRERRESLDRNGNVVKGILRVRGGSIDNINNSDRKIKFHIDSHLYELDELDINDNELCVDNDIQSIQPINSQHIVQPQQINKIDKLSPKSVQRHINNHPIQPLDEIDELTQWITTGTGKKPLNNHNKQSNTLISKSSAKTRQKMKISDFKKQKEAQKHDNII